MNENKPLASRLHRIKTSNTPFFSLLLAELRLLHAVFVFPPDLLFSPRRLFYIAVKFPPDALNTLTYHLTHIIPPLAILVASLAVYAPSALDTLIHATTAPLLLAALAFYLAYFARRHHPWAPRIFSPIPWAALRLTALTALAANIILTFPPTLLVFALAAFTITTTLVLMHYTTLILAADILAPRRIHAI